MKASEVGEFFEANGLNMKEWLYENGYTQTLYTKYCQDIINNNEELGLEFIYAGREDSAFEWVFKIKDQYFAVYGSYDSWNGTEMYDDDILEVEPKQVTYTEYHIKKDS